MSKKVGTGAQSSRGSKALEQEKHFLKHSIAQYAAIRHQIGKEPHGLTVFSIPGQTAAAIYSERLAGHSF